MTPSRRNTVARGAGFTLIEVMVVCGIISLMAALAIPNYVRARSNSQRNMCIDNLRQIDGAKQQWGLEQHKGPADTALEADLAPYLGRKTGAVTITFSCPAGGSVATTFSTSYEINPLDTPPTCKVDPVNHKLN